MKLGEEKREVYLHNHISMFGKMPKPVGNKNHRLTSAPGEKPLKQLQLCLRVKGRARFIHSNKLDLARIEVQKRPGTKSKETIQVPNSKKNNRQVNIRNKSLSLTAR